MPFEKYGGYVWQSDATTPQEDYRRRGLGLAVVAALGGAGAYGATSTLSDGTRPIDQIYQGAKLVGNMSPFSILNTFRAPEWMSPFLSEKAQGLKGGVFRWDREFLGSAETIHYLGKATGLSQDELRQRGLFSGMAGDDAAEYVEFRRNPGSHSGSLVSIARGQEHLLSNSVALMQASPEEAVGLARSRKINRAAQAVVQSVGATGSSWFDVDNVLSDAAGKGSTYIPIPSVTGQLSSLGDLGRRTALARAVPAFGMERLNTLLEGVTGQMPFVGDLNQKLDTLVGANLKIRSGTATEMFARFGGKAAMVGGAWMGLQTVDWARQEFGPLGEVGASAVVAGAVGAGLSKLGKTPKTAFMAATASFFGQLVLPGFDHGVVPGIATLGVKANIARAAVSPFNWYRRTVEGFLPGVTGMEMGILAGVAAAGAAIIPLPFTGKRIPEHLLERFGNKPFGLEDTVDIGGKPTAVRTPTTTRQEFWSRLEAEAGKHLTQNEMAALQSYKGPLSAKRAQLSNMLRKSSSFAGSHAGGYLGRVNDIFQGAEDHVKEVSRNNPVNQSLLKRFDDINKTYLGRTDFGAMVGRRFQAGKASVAHAFFGADPLEAGLQGAARKMGFNPTLGRAGLVFGAVFAAHGILSGGWLGSMDTAGELEATYSGRKLVEVKKSRFWEAGGTPFGGDKVSYFRPHQYHLMMNRTREKGLWGEDEGSTSPIGKFLKKNFTYDWERENYYDRPYPITGAAFQDVPVIGGILASTIGKVIKPARIMHASEWIREGAGGGFETADVNEGYRREPAYNLGALGSGLPEAPLAGGRVLGGAMYQFRELEGMTGWAKNVMSNIAVGEDTYFDDKAVLASSNLATSPTRMFWEMQMGGGAFMNEAVRRFLPRPPGEGETINPIMNSMPSWLPEKFRYGDPYTSVEHGEARLPGAGFASLHPELKGVDPEAYPLLYKYSILADVAMHSEEFRRVRTGVYRQRAEGKTSESQNQYIDYVDSMVQTKMDQYGFTNVHKNAIMLPGAGAVQSGYGFIKQSIRDIVAPAEYLVPMGFRPFQKLMGDRSAIDQYEYERLYGTKMAFWDKPWRDWFRPSLYSAAHMMGFEGKPLWRMEADATGEYFDKLEFMKWMQLSQQAGEAGDLRKKMQFQYLAAGTRAGVNPMGNPLSIYWTLPAEERVFFNAFANAQGAERDRVLEMVPADQTGLYKALWSRVDAGDPGLYPGDPGAPNAEALAHQYAAVQAEMGQGPPPDWIGWHQDVDMSDIKVRYISQMGKDLHDYGMWESELKKSETQPFLDGSTDALTVPFIGRGEMTGRMRQATRGDYQAAYTEVHQGSVARRGKFVWNDNREPELMEQIRSFLE